MERIRILEIIPTLDQSGAEKQLALLATHLPPERFEVAVCALTRGGYYEHILRAGGIPVDIIGKRFKWDPTALFRLARRIRQYEPLIVHTWLFAGNCYGRLAARWAKAPHVVASERCVDRWKRQYQFALDRRLARWTDSIVVNSQAVRAFYEQVGIAAAKLRVIPNAIAPLPGEVVEAAGERETVLAELGIAPNQPTLGFIGRLWPQKRVQDLIWATDVLRISGWQVNLLIIGEGPRRPALERFTRSLELNSLVHFLGHRKDTRRLLSAMDVVALPSTFEGMPNAALEAMQAGKPVVAARIAGMDEVVVDGSTGVLVEPKRPFAIAQAVHELLSDPAKRERMGRAGQSRVKELFSLDRMIGAYAQLFEELAERRQA